MIKIILILSLVVGLVSCGEKVKVGQGLKDKCGSLDVNLKDICQDKSLSDLIEIDSIIPLETSDRSLIGTISEVYVLKDRLYIKDRVAKAVYCFNEKGKFITLYKKIGKGPQEYRELNDVAIHDEHIYILVDYQKVLKLDRNLQFVEEIKINWNKTVPEAQYFHVIDSEHLAFANGYLKTKINVYSLKANKFINNFAQTVGRDQTLPFPPYLKSYNDQTIVMRHFVDTIYTLTKNQMIPYKAINFENPISTEEKIRIRKLDFMRRPVVRDKMYNIGHYYENEDFISFDFLINSRKHYYMYDKIDGEIIMFNNKVKNDLFGSKYFPIIRGYYKESIIISAEASDFLDVGEKYKGNKLKGLTPDSNPVLIFYHPKFENK